MDLFRECEDVEDLCLDAIDHSAFGVVFEIILFLYSFVGIANVADAHLTSGLETLVHRWGIPEDVAGASFLALGSAAPEIVVAAVSTAKNILAGDEGDAAPFATSIAVSSVLGSGMMAFTLIPGLCAMAVPAPMQLKRRPFARDALFYLASLIMLWAIVRAGEVKRRDALAMLVLYAVYLVVMAFAPAIRQWYRVSVCGMPPKKGLELGQTDLEEPLGGKDGSDGGDDDDEDEAGPIQKALSVPFQPMLSFISWTCPECEVGTEGETRYPITLIAAFAWLTVFSTILSATVTRWGTLLNLPATAMGAFVVAVGAQIPDTVQAIAVARRGHGSMAVASAVGSQVINILIGLGVPWMLTTAAGLPVMFPDQQDMSLLMTMTYLMFGCVAVYMSVLLPTLPTWGGVGTAELGRPQGWYLFVAYAIAAAIFVVVMMHV